MSEPVRTPEQRANGQAWAMVGALSIFLIPAVQVGAYRIVLWALPVLAVAWLVTRRMVLLWIATERRPGR